MVQCLPACTKPGSECQHGIKQAWWHAHKHNHSFAFACCILKKHTHSKPKAWLIVDHSPDHTEQVLSRIPKQQNTTHWLAAAKVAKAVDGFLYRLVFNPNLTQDGVIPEDRTSVWSISPPDCPGGKPMGKFLN